MSFYAVALEGNNNLEQVQVMNSDDGWWNWSNRVEASTNLATGFRHFFLNTTNQQQLTGFVNQTANNIQRTFPAGLFTSVGVVVANPAYGVDPVCSNLLYTYVCRLLICPQVYAQNFTTGAYHGTVVWSWNSLAMLARGLYVYYVLPPFRVILTGV